MEQTYIPALPFNGMTKGQLSGAADLVVTQAIDDGKVLEIAEACSGAMEFVERIKKDPRFMDAVRSAATRPVTTASGAKIESCEVGTKYDYSKCEDVRLNDLYEQKRILDEQVKQRESMLRTLPPGGDEFVDTENGNVWRAYPPAKSSVSSFKITLAQ